MTKRIAIIGGGPSALFMYKRFVEAGLDLSIDIFERSSTLGAGMPYSKAGAGDEHITNVSGNEIPDIVSPVKDWVNTLSDNTLEQYHISAESFSDYRVFPRLFFGRYLSGQFDLLLKSAKAIGLVTHIHLNAEVADIIDLPDEQQVRVRVAGGASHVFDNIVICTGHTFPLKHEGKVPNYFDSPYPPHKLAVKIDYPVAVRGSSLTAIDAIRTLARCNGIFVENTEGMYDYRLNEKSKGFRLIMHSRAGMLPAIRFHLEDSHFNKESLLGEEAIQKSIVANGGFLSLDYIFEKDFKDSFRNTDPEMYERIRDMNLEQFVDEMMLVRKTVDAFTLFEAEYAEAEKSIKRKQSVYWKEMLAVLSFAMNYPAKHFSAEDMLRLQKVLMPLISIVIAFVPQSSAKELIALHNAGVLEIVAVGNDSTVEPGEKGGAVITYTDDGGEKHLAEYKMFVDSIGQPHLQLEQFPFRSLLEDKTVSRALVKFRSAEEGEKFFKSNSDQVEVSENGDYYLKVPGISINDFFQVLDRYGALNPRIFIMAVPYIAGFNPDYSGLDFCEEASAKIISQLLESNGS